MQKKGLVCVQFNKTKKVTFKRVVQMHDLPIERCLQQNFIKIALEGQNRNKLMKNPKNSVKLRDISPF